jgi:hypothetical protein
MEDIVRGARAFRERVRQQKWPNRAESPVRHRKSAKPNGNQSQHGLIVIGYGKEIQMYKLNAIISQNTAEAVVGFVF